VLLKLHFNRSYYNHYSLTTYEDLIHTALFKKYRRDTKAEINNVLKSLEEENFIEIIGNYKNVIEYKLRESEIEDELRIELKVDEYIYLKDQLDYITDFVAYCLVSTIVRYNTTTTFKRIAEIMRCSTKTTRNALQRLEDNKLIKIKKKYEEGSYRQYNVFELRPVLRSVS